MVHGEAGADRGIAVGVTEGIEAEERYLGAADIEIGNQLVLVIEAGGLILIQVGNAAVRPRAAGIGRVRRVDVPRNELMEAVGVEIGHGDRGDFRNLPLQPYASLGGVGCAQMGIDLIDRGGCGEGAGGRDVRVKIG